MTRKPTDRNSPRSFSPTLPSDQVLTQFSLPMDSPGLNALVVGSSVFETEQALRDGQVRKVIVPYYNSKDTKHDLVSIRRLIHELLIFTLVEDVEIKFRSVENVQTSLDLTRSERSAKNICLFSGGTDSFSGVLVSQQVLSDLEAAFCAHTDQSRTIHIVDELESRFLRRNGIYVEKIRVPSVGIRGYAQLRGFLYLLAAASVAHKLGSERIIVTECGPTMYQPRFSPLDSVTMTTHPFVVRTAAQVASLLLNRELKIITPFENLTKAEVIAICPEKEGLRYTHSCISQRFGSHDGTCYGCVIRRLATIAAGVPDVRYRRNPIADPNARSGNLYSLLTFCYEVLTHFNEMEEYERGTIDTYGKRDLFRRFALDNFAAIQRLLSENKRVVRPIRDMYESLVQKVGAQAFTDRLAQLERAQMLPNFKKLVI
jgi:7-cyano-7-deazaguanine synthase in queuosine biosynthesis